MVYNLGVIKTVEQCDAVLTELNAERTSLNVRRGQIIEGLETDTSEINSLPERIASLQIQITDKQTELSASTNPVVQANLGIEINNMESAKLRLIRRQHTFGSLPYAERQFFLGRLEMKIAAYDEFITAMEIRKSEIVNQ